MFTTFITKYINKPPHTSYKINKLPTVIHSLQKCNKENNNNVKNHWKDKSYFKKLQKKQLN